MGNTKNLRSSKILLLISLSFCLVFVYLFQPVTPAIAQTIKPGPPLPDDARIVSPALDLPNEIKALSGYWEGTWIRRVVVSHVDGTATLEAILVVEKIDAQSATVIYAEGNCPSWFIEKGWRRHHVAITFKERKLAFSFEGIRPRGRFGPRGILTFMLDEKGNLEGQSSTDFSAEIKMVRKETAFAKKIPAVEGRGPGTPNGSPAPLKSKHKELALAYAKKGQYDEALVELNQTLAINPKDAEAYNNRGNIYTFKGQYDNAIADLDQALKLNPRYAKAHYNRGLAHYYQGRYDQAIVDLNKAIEISPKDAEAYHNRGLAYDQKKDYDKAIEDFNMAIALKKGLADAYFNKAVTCEKGGRREEAREAYEGFLKYASPEAKNLIELARSKLKEL